MARLAYYVPHNGKDQMVGRLFPLADGHMCFHEERKPSQKHFNTDSPGGADACLVEVLCDLPGVVMFAHYIRGDDLVYLARPDLIRAMGERHNWDGRDRYFLPRPAWHTMPRERLNVPAFIKRRVTLQPRRLPRPTSQHPEAAWVLCVCSCGCQRVNLVLSPEGELRCSLCVLKGHEPAPTLRD